MILNRKARRSYVRTAAKVAAGAAIATTGSTATIAVVAIATKHPTPAGATEVWDTGTTSAVSPIFTAYFETAELDDDFGIIFITKDTWRMSDGIAWTNYKTTLTGAYYHYDILNQDYWQGTINPGDTGDPDTIEPAGVSGGHGTHTSTTWTGIPTQKGCPAATRTRDTPPSYTQTPDPCVETARNVDGNEYIWPQVVDSEQIGSAKGNYFVGGTGYASMIVMDRDIR
jgi:hypothetical protein